MKLTSVADYVRSWRRGAAVATLFGLWACAGHAEDPTAAAFRSFGLPGVWARDCGQPPSRDNPQVVYDVPEDGVVIHSVSFDGVTIAFQDTAADAALLPDDLLRYSVVREGRAALVVTLRRRGGRMRTMQSVGVDGTIYYSDGVEVETGRPSVEFERCARDPPSS